MFKIIRTGQEDSDNKPTTRRKIKTTPIRRKPKEREDSSEDEEDDKQAKKPPRRRQIPRPGADIITMVSLVSPAESDNEELPIITNCLIPIENEKQDNESQPEAKVEPFILQNLRKTVKTGKYGVKSLIKTCLFWQSFISSPSAGE